MVSPKPADSSANTSSNGNKQTDISVAVSRLSSVLSSIEKQHSEEEADSELAVLLKQLDTADDVAQGVESRLDEILENLEGMLKNLEATQSGLSSANAINPEERPNDSG